MIPLRDDAPRYRTPWVTWTLILVNCIIFLYEFSLPNRQLERLMDAHALVPAQLGTTPESYLTLFTNQFLHGGLLHIAGNMWILYLFGDNVEDRLGPARFLSLYLIAGVFANIAHWFVYPLSAMPVIGASGAIAGVMGAYLFLFPHARVLTLVPLFVFFFLAEIPAVVYLVWWIVLQVISGALAAQETVQHAGVAWWAHIGGFGIGLLLAPLLAGPPAEQPQEAEFVEEDELPW
jgi:membrane associated rhomboid family serine protease